MIIPENDPIRSKKDVGAIVGADHESKQRKPVSSRKEFKEVMGDGNKEIDDYEDSTLALSKTNPDGEKEASLMSMFGKTYVKAKLTDPADQKMLLEEGTEISPFTEVKSTKSADPLPNQPNVNVKTEKQADSSFVESSEIDVAKSDNTHLASETPPLLNKLKSNVNSSTSDDTVADLSAPVVAEVPVDPLAKKEKFNPLYTTTQPDISYLNPHATTDTVTPINLVQNTKVEQTVAMKSPIHDLVAEMIEKLTIVELKGQTDTVITLNHPGIFKGTIVVMSQFDTANGQLNLAFENLTSHAKALLDVVANRESLLQILSEKGYIVQSFVTTTIIEHKPIVTTQADSQFGRPREDVPQKDQRGDQKKQ